MLFRNSILFLMLTFGFTANAFGGLIISVDLDDAPLLQTSREFSSGQTFTAGIFMEMTAPTTLGVYNFSVRYDTTELSYVSRTEFGFGLLGESDTSNGVNTTTGTIFRIDGAALGPAGQVTPLGPVRVASLVFTTLSPTGGIADIDIIGGLFQTDDDLFFDNDFSNITTQVVFQGASITAVPEPSSFALMAISVGAWAYGIRRRLVARC
jgi:hypothetical protein